MYRPDKMAETMRAALNELAVEAPIWLQEVAPPDWYKWYGRRIEDGRHVATAAAFNLEQFVA